MTAIPLSPRSQYWLRPLATSHLPTIVEWMEQIEDISLFHRWIPVPSGLQSVENEWRRVLEEPEPRSSYWFIVTDSDGTPKGFAGIKDIVYSHGHGIVPVFISEDARRSGIAIRVLALLMDLAFNQLRLTRMTTFCREDNVPSLTLCSRIGFREEGRMRKAWYAAGKFRDLVVLGLLSAEWQHQRPALERQLKTDCIVSLGTRTSRTWTWPAPLPLSDASDAKTEHSVKLLRRA